MSQHSPHNLFPDPSRKRKGSYKGNYSTYLLRSVLRATALNCFST